MIRPWTNWVRRRRERRRAGRAARRLVLRDARSILGRHWYLFLPVLIGPVAVFAAATAVWTRFFTVADFHRGLWLGLTVGLSFGAAALLLLSSFNLERRLTGADAERWSTTELLKLERDGWRLINDVPTDHGNIDHVLVGEHAVLVIETKTIDRSPWTADSVVRACRQAERGVRRVHQILKQSRVGELQVVPVVLRWGIGSGSEPAVASNGEVTVLSGAHSQQWRRRIVSGLPSERPCAAAIAAIEAYADPRRTNGRRTRVNATRSAVKEPDATARSVTSAAPGYKGVSGGHSSQSP